MDFYKDNNDYEDEQDFTNLEFGFDDDEEDINNDSSIEDPDEDNEDDNSLSDEEVDNEDPEETNVDRFSQLQENYISEGYDYYTAQLLAKKDIKIAELSKNFSKSVKLSPEDERAYKYYAKRNPKVTREQYKKRVLDAREKHSLY